MYLNIYFKTIKISKLLHIIYVNNFTVGLLEESTTLLRNYINFKRQTTSLFLAIYDLFLPVNLGTVSEFLFQHFLSVTLSFSDSFHSICKNTCFSWYPNSLLLLI